LSFLRRMIGRVPPLKHRYVTTLEAVEWPVTATSLNL
jgi:hypothetical protein